MPLPYYSDKHEPFGSDPSYLLFFDDIKKTLGHITAKDVGLVHPLHMRNIGNYYYYAQQALYIYPSGVLNWQRTIEIYFELIKLVVQLGSLEKLGEIYFKGSFKINEGLQALYHEEQRKSSKEDDWRIRINALMHKYHTLYEANVRYSIVMAIVCLDIISDHKDAKKKTLDDYFDDDLSYHLKKIEKCKEFTFQNQLEYLEKGINSNVRNAIGHKKIEYTDEETVILKDRKWEDNFAISDFERMIQFIMVNYYGQITAQLLFAYDYHEKIDLKGFKPYTNLKQLRILIDQEIRNSFLIAKDIRFENNNSLISCDLEKSLGFDHPSEIFMNYHGATIGHRRPGLNLEEYVFRVIYHIALLNTDFTECTINVNKFDGTSFGSMTVDLNGANEIAREDDGFNELKKRIISNSIKDEVD